MLAAAVLAVTAGYLSKRDDVPGADLIVHPVEGWTSGGAA